MGHQGWNKELESGSEDLDRQHQDFFARIDEFLSRPPTRENTLEMLNYLEHHAKEHFGLEESYMNVYQYPDREAHKAAHRSIAARLAAERARLEADGPSEALQRAVADVVNVWLKDQITKHDRAFVAFLKAQPKDK